MTYRIIPQQPIGATASFAWSLGQKPKTSTTAAKKKPAGPSWIAKLVALAKAKPAPKPVTAGLPKAIAAVVNQQSAAKAADAQKAAAAAAAAAAAQKAAAMRAASAAAAEAARARIAAAGPQVYNGPSAAQQQEAAMRAASAAAAEAARAQIAAAGPQVYNGPAVAAALTKESVDLSVAPTSKPELNEGASVPAPEEGTNWMLWGTIGGLVAVGGIIALVASRKRKGMAPNYHKRGAARSKWAGTHDRINHAHAWMTGGDKIHPSAIPFHELTSREQEMERSDWEDSVGNMIQHDVLPMVHVANRSRRRHRRARKH